MTTFILVFSLIIVLSIIVMIIVIIGLFKVVKKQRKTIKQQEKNLKILADYQAGIEEIKSKNQPLIKKIREAKNDDEIFSAIGDLYNANNKRLQNS